MTSGALRTKPKRGEWLATRADATSRRHLRRTHALRRDAPVVHMTAARLAAGRGALLRRQRRTGQGVHHANTDGHQTARRAARPRIGAALRLPAEHKVAQLVPPHVTPRPGVACSRGSYRAGRQDGADRLLSCGRELLLWLVVQPAELGQPAAR